MPVPELIDETFDINSSENYELSLQISPQGFSYCILDTIRNKYILFRSTETDENKSIAPERTEELIAKDNVLSAKFKRINIVFPSPKSTLVPAPLFDPEKEEEYFTLNLTKEDNEIILSNKIPEPDSYIIFSVPLSYYKLTEKFFSTVTLCHHTKPLINHVSHSSKNEFGMYVQLHLEKEYFNLLILEHGSLKFYNTFIYKNINDILYYLFNVYKNMGINRLETVWFSGLTKEYDGLYSEITQYLKNIKFSVPEGNFSFSYVFNEIELHRYINLFNITSCE